MSVLASPTAKAVLAAAEFAAEEFGTGHLSGEALWCHGLVVGLHMALRDPERGRALRQEIERLAGAASGASPERIETDHRAIADRILAVR